MGVDVDDYMTTQSQSGDNDWTYSSSEAASPSRSGGEGGGGDDDDDRGNESTQPGSGASGRGVGSVGGGSENILMSQFTAEQNFDHITQDEDHSLRPTPQDQTYGRRRYRIMEVDESGHPIQNRDVNPMTATMDSLSIGSGRHGTSSSTSYGYGYTDSNYRTHEAPSQSSELGNMGYGPYGYPGAGMGSYDYGYGSHGYDTTGSHNLGYGQEQPYIIAAVEQHPNYLQLGRLVGIDARQYEQYIQEYTNYYNYMSWAQYCHYLEQQFHQPPRNDRDDDFESHRSSMWL